MWVVVKKNSYRQLRDLIILLTVTILIIVIYRKSQDRSHHNIPKAKSPFIVSERKAAAVTMWKHTFFQDQEEINSEIQTGPKDMGSTKIIVFYNMPAWWNMLFEFEWCEYSNCEIVSSQNIENADIVLFHGVDVDKLKPPPRPPGQIWLLLGNEAPVNFKNVLRLNESNWRSVFNWTSTHRVDSDFFAPYGLLMEKENPPVGEKWLKHFEEIANSKTQIAVWLVSNCFSQSGREEYVEELQKYIQIDVLGKCGTYVACHKSNTTCTRQLFTPFIFTLAFENALCTDYVTEKFFRLYEDGYNTIPIVRGRVDYKRYFPKGTFIDVEDFESPKHLAIYLNRLAKNRKAIAKMLQEKARYKTIKLSRQCQLCQSLHQYQIDKSGLGPSVSEEDRRRLTNSYDNVFDWMIRGVCY